MTLPISANIVTGFLGSGKTTLIRHALNHGLKNERVAVIMNEMADLGIDGRVLQGINVDKMVELNSGCICCSGFLQLGIAVQEIVETANPTFLMIECSGVAEVAPVLAELRGIGLRTDAVITLVDAENFTRLLHDSEVAREQIENADFLVLNKTDLVSSSDVDHVEKLLRKLNPRSLIFRTHFGSIETNVLFASSVRRYRETTDNRQGVSHAHSKTEDGFKSFVYEGAGRLDRNIFVRFLEQLPREIYRSKGIVHFNEESQPSLFNYVCGRYTLDWISLGATDHFINQAVFIGRDVEQHKRKILESLRLCRKA